MKHGIRSLVCQNQHTCYTKQILSEDVDFYLMITKAHINSKLQTPTKQVESNVQSLIDLNVDTMPHQLKGIENGKHDVQ